MGERREGNSGESNKRRKEEKMEGEVVWMRRGKRRGREKIKRRKETVG